MPWTRLDDQFFANPKVVDLGKDAKLVYLAALTYCGSQLTDGVIKAGAVRMVAAMVDAERECVAELVDAGLWEVIPEGYRIHDYLMYNPSGEQVKAERANNAKRQQEWRERNRGETGQFKDDVTPPATNAERNAVTNTPSNTAPYPSRTHPVPLPVPVPVPIPSPTPATTPNVVADASVGTAPAPKAPLSKRVTPAPKRKPPKKPETAAPDEFPVSVEMEEWADATCPDIDLDRETRRFLDSARAKGRTYADWLAAWRSWMTNDFPKAMKSGRGRQSSRAAPYSPRETTEEYNKRTEREVTGYGSDDIPGVVDAAWRAH